jgi:hypothetical protein
MTTTKQLSRLALRWALHLRHHRFPSKYLNSLQDDFEYRSKCPIIASWFTQYFKAPRPIANKVRTHYSCKTHQNSQ